jgi:hypothetical protein
MKNPISLPAIAAICALAVLATLADAAPRSVRASYAGFMNGMGIGTINEVYEADGASYRIVSETKPTGLAAVILRQPLHVTSAGQLAREGLRPAQFEARRSANESPVVSALFDWTGKQLTIKHDGKTESMALPPGTQDRLSVMYQFMFIPPERLRQLEIPMTNGRKLSRYHYRVADEAEIEIDTGLGRLRTVHLVKQRDPDDPVTEVWLSPVHQYLPVKMLIIDRNMRFEQIIQSVDVRD